MKNLKIVLLVILYMSQIAYGSSFTGVKGAKIYYKNQRIEAIDIHFHAADSWDQLGPLGQRFIKSKLPGFMPDFLKEISLKTAAGLIYNPYGLLGIKRQCLSSGLTYCGIFATYAAQSWGVIDNEYIMSKLASHQNQGLNGKRNLFFGLASIDVLSWEINEKKNLASLEKALNYKLIKGIKLAFIHNQIALDVEAYDSIYDLAKKYNVPVYHHVGSSPLRTLDDFDSEEERRNYLRSYDPTLLSRAVKKYHDVIFIFGHMGFDFNDEGYDFSDSVFELAQRNKNIYLEISAFGHHLFDPNGKVMDHVLGKLKRMKMLGRTLYGSDGPLYPGATKEYLLSVLWSMERLNYNKKDVEKVLYNNSARIFDLL